MGRLVVKGHPEIEIVGTLETLSGVALIGEVSSLADFEYAGETKVWWDDQRTVVRDGQRIFVDDDGEEYLESQVEVIDDD